MHNLHLVVACFGQSTFIELIPEFYENSTDFLLNRLNVKATEGSLNDVELPPWAGNSPERFLSIMRHALETDLVSRYLADWIDLVFGFKQRGKEALLAKNLFHPLTYADASVAVSSGSCPIGFSEPLSVSTQQLILEMSPDALEAQLEEFGQTPIQLFNAPHPKRLICPNWKASAWEGDPYKDAPWFIYLLHHPLLRLDASVSIALNAQFEYLPNELLSANVSTMGRISSMGYDAEASGSVPMPKGHRRLSDATAAPRDVTPNFGAAWPLMLRDVSVLSNSKRCSFALPSEALQNLSVHSDTIFCVDGMDGCLRVVNPMKLFESDPADMTERDAYNIYGKDIAFAPNLHPSTPLPTGVEVVRIGEVPLTSVAHLQDSNCVALGCFDGSIIAYTYERQPKAYAEDGGSTRLSEDFVVRNMTMSDELKLCHADTVTCLTYEAQHYNLVSGSSDETVRVWSVTPSGIVATQIFDDQTDEITSVVARSNLVLSGSSGGQLFLWDMRAPSTAIWSTTMSHAPASSRVHCELSDRYIHSFAFPHKNELYPLSSQRQRGLQKSRIPAQTNPSRSSAVPLHCWDIRRLIHTPKDYTLQRYNASQVAPPQLLSIPSPQSLCGITDGFRYVLIGNAGSTKHTLGSVSLYNLQSNRCIKTWALERISTPTFISIWPPGSTNTQEKNTCTPFLMPNKDMLDRVQHYIVIADASGQMELIGFNCKV